MGGGSGVKRLNRPTEGVSPSSEKRVRTTVKINALHPEERKNELYALPKAEELHDISQSAALYKSNLFRLQATELRNSLAIDYTKCRPVEDFISRLEALVKSFPPVDVEGCRMTMPHMHFKQIPKSKLGLAPHDALQYVPPRRLTLVGSFGSLCVVKPHLNVDVAVEMEPNMFVKGDHLNYRYFTKRAAFAGTLHSQLHDAFSSAAANDKNMSDGNNEGKRARIQGKENAAEAAAAAAAVGVDIVEATGLVPIFQLVPWYGDIYKPVILVQLRSAKSNRLTGWCIRLLPALPTDVFTESKLAPHRNAVRPQFNTGSCSSQPIAAAAAAAVQQPNYDHTTTTTTNNVVVDPVVNESRPTTTTTTAIDIDLSAAAATASSRPTPYYNGCILEDTRFERIKKIITDAKHTYGDILDTAISLLKTWISRRHLTYSCCPRRTTTVGSSSSSGDIVVAPSSTFSLCGTPPVVLVCCHLASYKRRVHFGSSYQLFKAVLTFLATATLDSADTVHVLGTPSPVESRNRMKGVYQMYDSVDQTFNILWRCQMHMQELQSMATFSLSHIKDLADPFSALFVSPPVTTPELADAVITFQPIPTSKELTRLPRIRDVSPTEPEFDIEAPLAAPPTFAVTDAVMRCLQVAMHNRLKRVHCRFIAPSDNTACDKDDDGGGTNEATTSGSGHQQQWQQMHPGIRFLLFFNATESVSQLVKGPSSEVDTTLTFKRFWQGLSSSRRFADSTVLECVLWKPPTTLSTVLLPDLPPTSRQNYDAAEDDNDDVVPSVNSQILQWLLHTYFNEFVHSTSKEPKAPIALHCTPLGALATPEARYIKMWSAFTELQKLLRGLDGLPLPIKDVRHCSDVLRNVDIHLESAGWHEAPRPVKPSTYVQCVHDVVIEFQGGTRWPNGTAAVQKLKTAFLIRVRDALDKTPTADAAITEHYLDIAVCDEIFRCRVFHPAEFASDAAVATNASVAPANRKHSEAWQPMRTLWWRPHIYSVFYSLSTRYPALAGTTRLTRLWCAQHLMQDTHDLIDHVCAHLYTSPHPHEVPQSPHVGLIRFFQFMSGFAWTEQPLLADLEIDSPLSDEIKIHMHNSFAQCAPEDRPSAWIASAFDVHALLIASPSVPTLRRMVACAGEALAHIGILLNGCSPRSGGLSSWTAVLFAEDKRRCCDIVIHLRSAAQVLPSVTRPLNRSGSLARLRKQTSCWSKLSSNILKMMVEKFVRGLECLIGDSGVILHNEMQAPLPQWIGIKFLYPAFALKPVAAHCAVPSCLIDHNDSGSSGSASIKSSSVPNIVFLVSSIGVLGTGLVHAVQWT